MWPFERNRAVHLVKIIKYYQKVNELDVSVDYNDNEKFKNTWTLFTALNPNEFNVYSVEWNETTIIWKLNSRKTLSANLEKIFPGLNEMHILIWQAVGGYVFETKDISLNDLKNWDCPTLLIDYVRYYRWVNESIDKEPVIKEDNPSRDSICMALEKSTTKLSEGTNSSEGTKSNNTDESNSSVPLIVIIVVIVLSVFLTIVLILCIWFYSKYKKSLRQNTNAVSDGNAVYDYVSYYSKPIYEENYDGVLNSPSSSHNEYLKMSN